ncbi:HTH LytTR-type domain-containing protein [Kibdelosporangium persicum]|uniref:Mobile element protein n=2 Tax=Kibdelosporangium persicum TaxID=2698649 RepID=A0ABX2EVT2_9PSEU|nr:hypothetical protein [Kibdelosporangium persicum]NRN62835.1 Mobile element protein [Kibdelosporangium persicum]
MRELKISAGPRPPSGGPPLRRWFVDYYGGALFVVDESARKVLAYERCAPLTTDLVLSALETALWGGAWHHGHTTIRYSERVVASGVDLTVGTAGESPLAQSMIQWYHGS